ncbi:hypothetical protein ACFSTH_13145 [Paenibacillus yanchengensis]|uniref:Uncharacterized protein n=1 Tax=Paenibacillus yanchengensis TaxID=2035833 RepID=A0ABW4YNC8_9BACL
MHKHEQVEQTKEAVPIQFLTKQHLQSKRWTGIERDVLASILEKEQLYTIGQVENKLKTYMKKGVN